MYAIFWIHCENWCLFQTFCRCHSNHAPLNHSLSQLYSHLNFASSLPLYIFLHCHPSAFIFVCWLLCLFINWLKGFIWISCFYLICNLRMTRNHLFCDYWIDWVSSSLENSFTLHVSVFIFHDGWRQFIVVSYFSVICHARIHYVFEISLHHVFLSCNASSDMLYLQEAESHWVPKEAWLQQNLGELQYDLSWHFG